MHASIMRGSSVVFRALIMQANPLSQALAMIALTGCQGGILLQDSDFVRNVTLLYSIFTLNFTCCDQCRGTDCTARVDFARYFAMMQ